MAKRSITEIVKDTLDNTIHDTIVLQSECDALSEEIVEAISQEGYDVT